MGWDDGGTEKEEEVKGGVRAHAWCVEGIHEACSSYEFHDRRDAEMAV